MTASRRIVAIGVVAALGVVAWTTLRNPDTAPEAPDGRGGIAGSGDARTPEGGQGGSDDPAPRPMRADRTGSKPGDAPPTDAARYLRGLDPAQVTERFSEMLDPGDCSQAIDPDGRIMRCNPQGVLNQRLQAQLEDPDPRWTSLAQRQLQSAVDAVARDANGRLRTVDVRCGRDVCQVLTIAPVSDHDRSGGWDDATRAFRRSAWWRDLGFVDMRLSMTSGADGHTVYYVTQLTTKPRP